MCSKTKAMNAVWQPVQDRNTGVRDLVQSCVRHVGGYAVINTVLFIWQQKDLLADEAAVPAMWVCALLAGYELGRCIAKGVR